MVNPDAPGFNPGAQLSRIDPRDFKWKELAFGSAPFNWLDGYDIEADLSTVLGILNFKLYVDDQNGSGSCGGQSWGTLSAAIEAFATKSYERRSKKFIYAQTYGPGGGSSGRANSELCIDQGDCLEVLCPSYDNGQAPSELFMERAQDITQEARDDAAKNKDKAYFNTAINIDEIAQAVRDNHGAIIGIVGSNNGTWSTAFPKPPLMSDSRWYHWMFIGKAKMINGQKFLGALNSWGTATGDAGWQWIPEEYINTMLAGDPYKRAVWDCWGMVWNPEPVAEFHHLFVTQMAYDSNSEEVRALQKCLQIDGEFNKSLKPTAYYGNITRTAVLKFQLKYKVDSPAALYALNGKNVGPKTIAALNKLFAPK